MILPQMYSYQVTIEHHQHQFLVPEKESDNNPQGGNHQQVFHDPDDCYYVFTDTRNKMIFVTMDCAEGVNGGNVPFTPAHEEVDTKNLARFFIHDRNSDKMELCVNDNFGEILTF